MRAQPRFGEFILQVAENPEDGRHVLVAYVSEISHHTFPERFLILDDMLSSSFFQQQLKNCNTWELWKLF